MSSLKPSGLHICTVAKKKKKILRVRSKRLYQFHVFNYNYSKVQNQLSTLNQGPLETARSGTLKDVSVSVTSLFLSLLFLFSNLCIKMAQGRGHAP